MPKAKKRLSLDKTSDARWQAALRGDRDAFQATVAPYVEELLDAARREVRHRVALGELGPADLTAEELVGETLARAWSDRQNRPRRLGVKAWLLAVLFRVSNDIVRREAQQRKLPTVSLEQRLAPEPVYDDDESFWEWYQPDEMTRWEDVVKADSISPEDATAADEEFSRSLNPREREVFLMYELHGVSLSEIALALGLSLSEASRLLADVLHRVGIGAGGKIS
jgi:RNA polymerase sigma factor (sigma-70 family)